MPLPFKIFFLSFGLLTLTAVANAQAPRHPVHHKHRVHHAHHVVHHPRRRHPAKPHH